MPPRRARDSGLLDAVEALTPRPYAGRAWRVVREGRDPLECSRVGGRWDDQTFDVLYTSTRADRAIAEMFFHVGSGQPVVPSRVKYRLHELEVSLHQCLHVPTLEGLAALGLKTSTFGRLSYSDRDLEYPRTQEIAEAAHFHGRDGILVPSARSEYLNLVVFCELSGPAAVEAICDHGVIEWAEWRKTPLGF